LHYISRSIRSLARIALCFGTGVATAHEPVPKDDILAEVIVTATLRPAPLVEVPLSVTVLDQATLQAAGEQHFEDVLGAIPNLHWAGGTSRPRYFQIRGIGERERYEGAPNPSVGFLIDDIDFSGIGAPATLFDVERIEVLRGPQGMRYGANALAGLIVVRGAEPGDALGFTTEASAGDYGSSSLGVSATGPVASLDSAWRLAVQRYRSDGFRHDSYLHRDDTDGRDELTARGKWRWQPSDVTQLDLTWLYADIDNGYDAFSIDNTRASLADRPGRDAQRSNGASLRFATTADATDFTVIAAAAHSGIDYSYDGDWGNAQSWAPYTYDYFYRARRERDTRSLEVRAASSDSQAARLGWLAGVYVLDLDERIAETSVGQYAEPGYESSTDDHLASAYGAANVALFGELNGQLGEEWRWSLGARGEERNSDYHDNGEQGGAARVSRASERDRLWGGQATLSYAIDARRNAYVAASRGYKAGGFNLGTGATIRERFGAESLASLEAGIKGESATRRVYWDLSAFHMWRQNPQVKTGDQLEPSDPNSFVIYTVNAARGTNYGLESSVRWAVTETFDAGATLALLESSLEGYDYRGTPQGSREQPHAPQYQASLNATWRHPRGFMARVDVSAVDDYYFDIQPNDQRAGAYALTNVKLGYAASTWSAYLWGRNVFDIDYDVRGFYFGNEPPLFENKRYVQLGEPRQVGVTVRVQF
jgi:iron complex outermembrane receptor protein